jgi:hypothetical protein
MSNGVPAGWKKTYLDLAREFPGRVPSPEEWEWARAYERTELRKWARFPVDGDIFEAVHDTPVEYLTHWKAPFTDGGSGVLPAGTRFRVLVMKGDAEPIRVYADPLDRDLIEKCLIPSKVSSDDKYAGFSLSITTADLNRIYRLVSAHVA